jgi:hypothetical protein
MPPLNVALMTKPEKGGSFELTWPIYHQDPTYNPRFWPQRPVKKNSIRIKEWINDWQTMS